MRSKVLGVPVGRSNIWKPQLTPQMLKLPLIQNRQQLAYAGGEDAGQPVDLSLSSIPLFAPHQLDDESRYLKIVHDGIEHTSNKNLKVVIIGAGMAGLVAGSLLKDAGHDVSILEASDRAGGRIKTLRDKFFSNGLYAEAGAMRIPEVHTLVNAYINKFSLPTRAFVMESDEGFIFVNGNRVRFREYTANPNVLGYPLDSHEQNKMADALLEMALGPIRKFIQRDPKNNWETVVNHYDKHSVRSFLSQVTYMIGKGKKALFSEGAIEMIGVLLNEEALMMTSFIESIRDQELISRNTKYKEIVGGNDLLPNKLGDHLKKEIRFNARVRSIDHSGDKIVVHYEDLPSNTKRQINGDVLIIAIPFSSLRHVWVEPSFSHDKRKAIRQLHYDTSTKILLEFSSRFWEDDGIHGGNTTTDLPIRFVYYPSPLQDSKQPGIVLASYTWCDDSLKWDSLKEKDRARYALDNLAMIHGDGIKKLYNGKFATHSWIQDENTCGAFALFGPEQQTTLEKSISSPEGANGKILFAGEHTTLKHGWIEGAIESGIKCALEVSNMT